MSSFDIMFMEKVIKNNITTFCVYTASRTNCVQDSITVQL